MATHKKSIILYTVLSIMIIASGSIRTLAASWDYRFTHNDHDALIIGEVISQNKHMINIDVKGYIVSPFDISTENPRKQLRPHSVTVVNIHGAWVSDLEIGNYVIASLNSSGNKYEVAWGLFLVDSLNHKTLNVLTYSRTYDEELTDFVNNVGIYTANDNKLLDDNSQENNLSTKSNLFVILGTGALIVLIAAILYVLRCKYRIKK